MSTKTRVTRKQAEAVLKIVETRYKGWLEDLRDEETGEIVIPAPGPDDRPKLFEDYQGQGVWVVSWESGPDDWAHHFNSGGINEEVYYTLATGEFGHTKQKAEKAATVEPVTLPARLAAKVGVEAYYSFALEIYEA
jgi:hypothetical protein